MSRITAQGSQQRFELLYALAYAGVFIGFIPFFTLFLPIKVQVVAPQDKLALLTYTAIAGVGVASVSNILFGWLSDRTYARRGTRRPWIAAGLGALLLAYAAVHFSTTPLALFCTVLLFQVALNMLFAPLLAVMADEVPHRRKGTVAGMMGIAHPMASLSGVLVTLSIFASEAERFALVCALTVAVILPFLISRVRGVGASGQDAPTDAAEGKLGRRDLLFAWLARLCMQAAGTTVMTYSFFYFQDVLEGAGIAQIDLQTRHVARTIAIATTLAVLLTLASGWLSDRLRRRKPFLLVYAGFTVGGLIGMAQASSWPIAAGCYILFITAYSGFIALLMAYTMQILPSPEHRGRDLGIFNLTNTLPEAAGTALAFPLLAEASNYSPMLLVVGILAGVGGLFVLLVRERRLAWTPTRMLADPS